MSNELTPAQRKRLRLKNDFAYYAEHCLKIRTKDLKIIPFKLNAPQEILHDIWERQLEQTGMVRVVILKGRQQGLSTYVGARLYHNTSQNRARKAGVATHKSDSTDALFDMTKRYHQNVPKFIRPSTERSSKKELKFDKLDSGYRVATAGGDGIFRGETISDLHASEIAFWKASSARKNWNGLEQSIPKEPGTVIAVESTANGVGNLFYDLWQGAVKGENGFVPVFIPWFVSPEYAIDPPADFERTHDENELAKKYGLDDRQLAWRRQKIATNGLDLFRQEYPCSPDEAFLTSGKPAFIPERLRARKEEIKVLNIEPTLMTLEGDKFQPHPRGELKVFEEPQDNYVYYIGADVGSGIKGALQPNGEFEGDPSVVQVLDQKKRQVAVWRGYVIPSQFAYVLAALGEWYNWCQIACENNNHGILPNHILYNDLDYPDVFQTIKVDETTQREMPILGFTTSVKTRPMLINQLRGDMRGKKITVFDETTLSEMEVFVENEAGKFEAEAGNHDDTVIALGIANHIHDGEWDTTTPIPDEMYVEAI
ncbi:MAG: terminase family protein [Pseudomonadota bacterium]